jgi:hypothetical protein
VVTRIQFVAIRLLGVITVLGVFPDDSALARSYEARIYATAASESKPKQSYFLLDQYPGPGYAEPSLRIGFGVGSEHELNERTSEFEQQVKAALALAGFTEATTMWEADLAIAYRITLSADEMSRCISYSLPRNSMLPTWPSSGDIPAPWEQTALPPREPTGASRPLGTRACEKSRVRNFFVGDLRLQAVEGDDENPAGLVPLMLAGGLEHFGENSGRDSKKVGDRDRVVRYLRGERDSP